MEANPRTIQQVFTSGGDIQYVLPHFQREYTWEHDDWQTLLEDVYATYTEYVTEAREPEHFMGSLVRILDRSRHSIPTYTLVDGQQRLTTLSLLLCAIRTVMQATDPDAAEKVGRMLVNPYEKETAPSRYKLVPTTKRGDRAAYIAILTDASPPQVDSSITIAYKFLLESVREKVASGDVDVAELYQTILQCFQVVTIDLKQDEQPYKIFESLNGKGKRLTPADLVRNYVAMTLPYTMQEEVFTKHWAFIDDLLQEKREVGSSGYGELTGFLRHYLAMRTKKLHNREHIYERFRDQVKDLSTDSFAIEIAVLHRFAVYYDRLLRPEHEEDPMVRIALKRLQAFEMSTAFPFMVRAYDARDRGEISPEQFLDVLKVLENYAVRRFLCGRQANYLNNMFPTLWDELRRSDFSVSLRERLATKQFPSDEEVRQAVRTRKVYSQRNARRLALIFETVNRYLSAGTGAYTVLDGALTFEHILPQSLTETWKVHIGETWEETFANYAHTLGNLTPVTQEWNSSLSNHSFSDKHALFRKSGLRINNEFFTREIERWDETAILARADWLTDMIVLIWPTIGSRRQSTTPEFTKPTHVTILGTSYPVAHWSAVLEQTAAVIAAQMQDRFTAVAEQFPHLFMHEKPSINRGPYHVTDEWWLCSYWGSKNIKKYCLQLVRAAGLHESDWSVEETG